MKFCHGMVLVESNHIVPGIDHENLIMEKLFKGFWVVDHLLSSDIYNHQVLKFKTKFLIDKAQLMSKISMGKP